MTDSVRDRTTLPKETPERIAVDSTVSRAFRLALLFALAFVLAWTAQGADDNAPSDPSKPCASALSRLVTGVAKRVRSAGQGTMAIARKMAPPRILEPQEYAALKERAVEHYFLDKEGRIRTDGKELLPTNDKADENAQKLTTIVMDINRSLDDAVRAQENHLDGLKLDVKASAKFLHDMELYLHNRRLLQGFRDYKRFLDWWHFRKEVYLNKPVVELLISEKMTIGDFVDHLHMQYLAVQLSNKNTFWAFRFARAVFHNPLAATAVASIAYGVGKLVAFVWQLMVLGPGVQMVNAYTEPVVHPLSNAARQRGAQDLAAAAENLQEVLSGSDDLNQFKRELESLTEDFKELPPNESKERWGEFELMYFRIFQRHQQLLPLHLRLGRKLYHEMAIANPVYLSSALADFDIQYWTHHRALKELERELEDREPTREDLREITIHRAQKDAAESRIASTLAAWKMYEFIYPEFSRTPLNSHHRDTLKGHYDKFRDNLRFEVYQEQFTSQMERMLEELDFHYKFQQKLQGVHDTLQDAATAQPEVVTPQRTGTK